jgi:flagellar FliL protein
MPDTKSEQTETDADDSGGKGRLIVTAVLCIGLAGAGFVLGGRLASGGDAEAASTEAEAEVAPEDLEPVVGGIVGLDPVNVNLADGHYLRIAIAIALSEDYVHTVSGGGGHGAAATEIPFETAPASDLVLGTFSGRDMTELATNEGRETARQDLLHGLENYYGEDIVTVYLTEFVMQ